MYKPLEDLESVHNLAIVGSTQYEDAVTLKQSHKRLQALLTKVEKLSEVDENILNGIIGSLESSGETHYSAYLQSLLDIVKEIKEE